MFISTLPSTTKKSSPLYLLAGIGVSVVIAILILVVLTICCYCKANKHSSKPTDEEKSLTKSHFKKEALKNKPSEHTDSSKSLPKTKHLCEKKANQMSSNHPMAVNPLSIRKQQPSGNHLQKHQNKLAKGDALRNSSVRISSLKQNQSRDKVSSILAPPSKMDPRFGKLYSKLLLDVEMAQPSKSALSFDASQISQFSAMQMSPTAGKNSLAQSMSRKKVIDIRKN